MHERLTVQILVTWQVEVWDDVRRHFRRRDPSRCRAWTPACVGNRSHCSVQGVRQTRDFQPHQADHDEKPGQQVREDDQHRVSKAANWNFGMTAVCFSVPHFCGRGEHESAFQNYEQRQNNEYNGCNDNELPERLIFS